MQIERQYIRTGQSRELDVKILLTEAAAILITAVLIGALLFIASRSKRAESPDQQRSITVSEQPVVKTIDTVLEAKIEIDTEREAIAYDMLSVQMEQAMEDAAANRNGRLYFPAQIYTDTYEYFYREDIPMPKEDQRAVFDACFKYNLDPILIYAIIWQESDFDEKLAEPGDGNGYMQVMYKWHRDRMNRLGTTDLLDGRENIYTGCDYLYELIERYGLERALGAYNTGSPRVNGYVRAVLNKYEKLWNGEYDD